MAIVNFTFDFASIPPNAVNVLEATESWKSYFSVPNTRMWTYETHNGICIEDYERNGYDDSDFYMIIWNEATNSPEHYCFASTRGWTYPAYGSKPDATPEVMEKYLAWKDRMAQLARRRAEEEELKTPRRGKEIKVVRGRKVPIGTTGRIFWIGSNAYGVSVGIQTTSGERHFTSIKNVEVIIEKEVV